MDVISFKCVCKFVCGVLELVEYGSMCVRVCVRVWVCVGVCVRVCVFVTGVTQEASRRDFYYETFDTNEVDCVLTTREVCDIIGSQWNSLSVTIPSQSQTTSHESSDSDERGRACALAIEQRMCSLIDGKAYTPVAQASGSGGYVFALNLWSCVFGTRIARSWKLM